MSESESPELDEGEAQTPTNGKRSAGLRAGLREAAERMAPKLEEMLEEAMGATKTTWGDCKCGKRAQVKVPDWIGRSRVVELLLNQGFGRPKADESEDPVRALLPFGRPIMEWTMEELDAYQYFRLLEEGPEAVERERQTREAIRAIANDSDADPNKKRKALEALERISNPRDGFRVREILGVEPGYRERREARAHTKARGRTG